MASKLEPHLDDIIEMVENGETLRDIGSKYGVTVGAVSQFLSKHPARAAEAYRVSAQAMADKAIAVLKDESVDIARGRELASHYRWESKMRDRARYGDKVDMTTKDEPIKQIVVIGGQQIEL